MKRIDPGRSSRQGWWRRLRGYPRRAGGSSLTDAIAFRQMMDLYMDWKLGTLTEAKIDSALIACRGLKGRVVPQPLDPDPKRVTIVAPASLKTFAEELRRELRHPSIEAYWRQHPTGIVVVEPDQMSSAKPR